MHLHGRVHTNGNLYLERRERAALHRRQPRAAACSPCRSRPAAASTAAASAQNKCEGTGLTSTCSRTMPPRTATSIPKELQCNGSATREVPGTELAPVEGLDLAEHRQYRRSPSPTSSSRRSASARAAVADPGVYWEKADLRIVLHVDQIGQLPGGPTLPYRIEVVDAGGNATRCGPPLLQHFMTDGAWNAGQIAGRGPSTYPGTMPIFITDVPFAAGSGCAPEHPGLRQRGVEQLRTVAPVRPAGAARGTHAGGGGRRLHRADGRGQSGRRTVHLRSRLPARRLLQLARAQVDAAAQHQRPRPDPLERTERRAVLRDRRTTARAAWSSSPPSTGPIRPATTTTACASSARADIPLPGGIGVSADPTGVTVVSDQAIYVLGDYNRGTAAGGLPRQPAR